MMHHNVGRKLGVTTAHRKAMLANMCSSLILNQRIETTLTRAKELRKIAERMITLGKRKTVHARRRALMVLRNKRAVKVVFDTLAPQFEGRMGGYTRILKLGHRRGDSAPMALIEYLTHVAKSEPSGTAKPKVAKPKKEQAARVKKAAPREEKAHLAAKPTAKARKKTAPAARAAKKSD